MIAAMINIVVSFAMIIDLQPVAAQLLRELRNGCALFPLIYVLRSMHNTDVMLGTYLTTLRA
jgi:hypothetical protein